MQTRVEEELQGQADDSDDSGGEAYLFGGEAEATFEEEGEVRVVVGGGGGREKEEDEGIEGAHVESHEVVG